MGADITSRQLAGALTFLSSFFILALKLISTASIQISIEGEQIVSQSVEGIFLYQDVLMLVAAALAMGVSAGYLAMSVRTIPPGDGIPPHAGEAILDERRKAWENVARTLGDQEKTIYELVLGSDGIMLQSDIVAGTSLSKSTVSRALDMLESKGLVEKRRRGMGNVIMLT